MPLALKKSIVISSAFVALHRWKDAPEKFAFLRDYHRHVFQVWVQIEVRHNDRDVEFFEALEKLNYYLGKELSNRKFDYSCEEFASLIFAHMQGDYAVTSVLVMEDGENGAVLELTDED